MNRAAFLLTFLACTVSADTPPEPCITVPVVSVYDGDTFTIAATVVMVADGASVTVPGPKGSNRWQIRFAGYDTPEIRGGCPESQALARIARDKVIELVAAAGGKAQLCGAHFHNASRARPVASVRVGGVDLADKLIGLGLARAHQGGERRRSWCPEVAR